MDVLYHGSSVDTRVRALARNRQHMSDRQLQMLRGPWHETRRRAVLDSLRTRHVRRGGTRATLITRLFGN